MKKKILIPLPTFDFDPSEAAIPWQILSSAGVEIVFATPQGVKATCDLRMLKGTGLGILASFLQADKNGRAAYAQMSQSSEFLNPIKWNEIDVTKFDGVILPGGHAQGMREYLESAELQKTVAAFFSANKPVGAICHGVVLVARSKSSNNQSVLAGKKTTALLAIQELSAWAMTCTWLGNYYRTYPITVEAEVRAALRSEKDFLKGPPSLLRDSPEHLNRGFTVQDGKYLSARWPGDAHRFAADYLKLLQGP
jgi:protease I